jgi:hypothetical protein
MTFKDIEINYEGKAVRGENTEALPEMLKVAFGWIDPQLSPETRESFQKLFLNAYMRWGHIRNYYKKAPATYIYEVIVNERPVYMAGTVELPSHGSYLILVDAKNVLHCMKKTEIHFFTSNIRGNEHYLADVESANKLGR